MQQHIELHDMEENKREENLQPRKPKPHILFEGELPPHYSGQNLPVELAIRRNLAIKALILQLFSIFAGFAFFFVRRVTSAYWSQLIACDIFSCKYIIARLHLFRYHRNSSVAKMEYRRSQRGKKKIRCFI
jgi:hypothetical protein